jgi:hypothetical protein
MMKAERGNMKVVIMGGTAMGPNPAASPVHQ